MEDTNGYLSGIGIQRSSDLDEAQGSEYDLLYLTGEAAGDFLDNSLELDKRRAALPRRIVISRRAGDEDNAHESLQAVTRESIELSSADDRKTAQIKMLNIYDEWLHFLKNRRLPDDDGHFPFSVYFDDLEEAAKNWDENDALTVPGFVNFRAFAGDIERRAVPWAEQNNKAQICLWRHTPVEDVVGGPIEPLMYYREQSYGSPLFSYISSLNPDKQSFQCGYLIRQIVEMALCRVLVVDERVSQTVAAETRQQASENGGSILGSMSHKLAWGGIWVVGRVKVRVKENGTYKDWSFSADEEKKRAGFTVGTNPSPENGLVTLLINFDPIEGELDVRIEYPRDFEHFPPTPEEIEIMSLHQSIFDTEMEKPLDLLLGAGLNKYEGGAGENLVWKMKPHVLSTCFHSGRGHPQDRLPKNAPYLDYSCLQVHLLNHPSKFFFVQQAFASMNVNT